MGYHKFYAWWVPKEQTDFHKTQRLGSALTFLQRHWKEGDEFLDRIMTGDNTWVQFMNAESAEQSKSSWMESTTGCVTWRHRSVTRDYKN